MHQFVKNLLTEWRRLELPFEGKTVVLGVSGGADSCSLLMALGNLARRKKIAHRLVAAHFNHHLRGEASDRDEAMVRALTARLGVELAVGHGHLTGQGNVEQNAREARYAFLTETAEKVGAFAVLTGHTVNDQAETFLINLLRGSGPDGLAGMRPAREMPFPSSSSSQNADDEGAPELPLASSLLLVRPLLTWAKRKETEGFCQDMDVEYCCDTMNEDTAFKRVRIRKILLPLLEDFNPRIVETLANTAALMQMCATTVPAQGIRNEPPDELNTAEIAKMERGELNAAIREWLTARRGTRRQLQLKHIEGVERLVRGTRSGRIAEVPGGRVVKSGGRLTYEENKVDKTGAGN